MLPLDEFLSLASNKVYRYYFLITLIVNSFPVIFVIAKHHSAVRKLL